MKPLGAEDEDVASTVDATPSAVGEEDAELSDVESSAASVLAPRLDAPSPGRGPGLGWVHGHTIHESGQAKGTVMEAALRLGWEPRKVDKLKDTYVVPTEPPTILRVLVIPFVLLDGQPNVLLCCKNGRCEPPGGTLDDLDVSLVASCNATQSLASCVDARRLGESVLRCAAREAKEELGAAVPPGMYATSARPMPAWLRDALNAPGAVARRLGDAEWNCLEGREKVKMGGILRLALQTCAIFLGSAPPGTPGGLEYSAIDAAKGKPKEIRAVPVSELGRLAPELGEGLGDWSRDALGGEAVRLIQQAARVYLQHAAAPSS